MPEEIQSDVKRAHISEAVCREIMMQGCLVDGMWEVTERERERARERARESERESEREGSIKALLRL
jgi:hypothetical protein